MPGEQVALPGRDLLSRLLDPAEAANSARTSRALLKALALKVAVACEVDRCSVFLRQGDQLVPTMAQFASGAGDRREWRAFKALGPYGLDDVPALAQAIRERRPVLVNDGAVTEMVPAQWVTTFGVRSLLVLPLVRRNEIIGILQLDNCRPAPIGEGSLPLARTLAAYLALAVDSAKLIEETRTRLRETQTLLTVSQVVGSTLDLQEVARRITREAARAVDADSAGIYMADKGGLRPLAGYHIPREFLEAMRGDPVVDRVRERLGEFVKTTVRTVWSDDVPNDHAFRHEIFRRFPVQSILLIPLKAREERVGVLVCVWWAKRRRLTESELHLVEAIAAQTAIAIVNARLYGEAEEAAVRRERMRVDGILHDTLSQTLFSMALRLEVFLDRVGRSKLRSSVKEIRRDVALMMEQVRQLLAPRSGVANGFPARLQALLEKYRSLKVPVDLTEHGAVGHLRPPQEDALERVLQDGLAAVAKRRRPVRLRVETWPDEVQFELADDDTRGSERVEWLREPPADLGLRPAWHSIRALGGEVEFWERHPSGLRLRGRLPLA